ncbi:hypothetical protein [Aromatoleum evansii]|uniref:hypothetical protein n=1 Tax=Aromatoleum evansii TaxID=59406 RepID=UPI00145D3382|nr:hypothetical protein [Aromatoleum evansii]NMG27557.1 hypothetical protein [Aromatoleum evansii]
MLDQPSSVPSAVPESPIDAELAAFITTAGVSISVGSSGAGLLPSITRGIGCRVATDQRRVSVFVVAEQSREVLDDVRDTRRIAAVFSQPCNHRTLQLKGRDAVVEALEAGDRERIERYRGAFSAELGAIGFGPLFTHALIDSGGGEIVAIAFTPCAAFDQTPGPRAGEPLAHAK